MIRSISADRFILCPTYAHSSIQVWFEEIWNAVKGYDNVAVAFHWYNPQAICGSHVTAGATFNESDMLGDNTAYPYMARMVTALNAVVAKSIPLVMTEGSVIADTTRIALTEQKKWAQWTHDNFKDKYKIPFAFFENGVYKNGTSSMIGKGEDYGFLDRTKLTWRNQGVVETLIDGKERS